MPYTARDFVVHEASLKQLQELKPNVAVLPWAATEGHNYHMPHGTDIIEANALSEAAVERANAQGARVALLPCVPFGIDHTQLNQVITISMRGSTQQALLFDVAESLVRQGIDRLVLLNFHGGNEFKSMIRDVMLDLPIFIVQVHGYLVAPKMRELLELAGGDHADEFETSLLLHLTPDWVAPLETAGSGRMTPSKLPSITSTPGVFAPRDWPAFTEDTGAGDPSRATAEKGAKVFEMLVEPVTQVLVELSAAKNGDFPYVVRED